MDINIPDLDELKFVKKCQVCNGLGKIVDRKTNKSEECFICNGDKVLLTNVGERFIEFLEFLGLNPDRDGWKQRYKDTL